MKTNAQLLFTTLLFILIITANCTAQEDKSAYIAANSSSTDSNSDVFVKRLLNAYPEHINKYDSNRIYMKNGDILIYDDGTEKSFKEKLKNADIEDMVNQDYINSAHPPAYYSDPGRFRNDDFLKSVYGKNRNEIEKNITSIVWMPGVSGKKLRVSRINGIDKKLLQISTELEALPGKYHKYVSNPAGGYVYRNIAGTNRLSAHSFGIAVDINVKYSHYWLWDTGSIDKDPQKYRNSIPLEIVHIFEKYGFIWGGSWYHYDTMHFEYRPELFKK